MTLVVYKRSYPETPTSCTLCSGGEEDCAHLFFECRFARMLWNRHTTPRVDTILETSFWDSIQKIGGKRRGFEYSRCFGQYDCSGMTNYSMGGWPPLRVLLMQWRVLWQPGPPDLEKEGDQCIRLSILVGQSPILLGDHHLYFSKKKMHIYIYCTKNSLYASNLKKNYTFSIS